MLQQNQPTESPAPEIQTPREVTSNMEVAQDEEKTAEAPREISVVQEQPTVSVAPAQVTNDDDEQAQAKPADEAEIQEEFSSNVEPGGGAWTKKVGDVIKQFEDEPYKEEEEAESLQVEYLDKRFGVKVNRKEHGQK